MMADDTHGAPSEKQVRLMMWIVPRSTSTVLSKCLSFVEGSKVFLEPYVCAYSLGTDRVNKTAPECKTEEIVEKLSESNPIVSTSKKDETSLAFDSSQCSYEWVKEQLEQAHTGKRLVFCKDMAYAITSHEDSIPGGYRHLFLIRHPLKVFPSWKKMVQFKIKMPVESYDFDKLPSSLCPSGRGFKEMYDLMVYLKEVHDQEAIIIDSDDLLANPKGTLSALFKTIGLPFDEKILKWEAGGAVSKQWVMSKEMLEGNETEEYFKNAFDSSCFLKPGGLPDRSSLSPDILRCVDVSMPYYDKMFANRLQPDEN